LSLFSYYSGLARQDLLFHQVEFFGTSRKTGSGNYCKTLNAIQRWDQKFSPFSAVIPVWRDKTSSSPSRDSKGTSRKTASGKYFKTLSVIQRSDQNFWPFYSGLARQDLLFHQVDCLGTSSKTGYGNYCKTLSAFQRSDQKLWPFLVVMSV